MTSWKEFPLRPHGQPWPGLKTSRRLMTAGGELEDCTNVIISTDDILEKRRGLVRGLSERFNGVVCGLFKYTDQCGVERIIVADESGISVRQPFSLPTFTIADCYPFDSFDGEDGDPLDVETWRNAGDYEQQADVMVPVVGAAALAGDGADLLLDESARWFKDACSRSYQVRISYAFQDVAIRQRVWIVLKGRGDLTAQSMFIGVVDLLASGTQEVRLFYVNSMRVFTLQGKATLTGAQMTGTLTLGYSQLNRVATLVADPDGASPQSITSQTLNAIQDLDLGQVSAIGCRHVGATQPDDTFGISVVDGGAV